MNVFRLDTRLSHLLAAMLFYFTPPFMNSGLSLGQKEMCSSQIPIAII